MRHGLLLCAVLMLRPALASGVEDPLLDAIFAGDRNGLAALLENGADPNPELPDGSSYLAWAVDAQDAMLVDALLRAGADPAPAGNADAAPLLIACDLGDPAVLDLLLDAGADVAATRGDGISALALCAGSAPSAVLARMITAGARIEQGSDIGQTPLMWAAAKGRTENLTLLIEAGADVNRRTDKGSTPAMFAVKSRSLASFRLLLEAGADPGYLAPDGTSLMQLAMYQGAWEIAGYLGGFEQDLESYDQNGRQLLHAAIVGGRPELVELLLAAGADANAATGESQIEWRYERNFKSEDYELLPRSALILAAENGRPEIMRLLVDAGADIGFLTADGVNVVLAAASSADPRTLDLALRLWPDPDVATLQGQTPLHLLLGFEAVTPDIVACMELLRERGARTDIPNGAGYSPAQQAEQAVSGIRQAYHEVFAGS